MPLVSAELENTIGGGRYYSIDNLTQHFGILGPSETRNGNIF